MAGKEITLYLDGWSQLPVRVDEEDFEIVKLMLKDVGADRDLKKVLDVVMDLVSQGWTEWQAINVCILARTEILKRG